MSKRNLKFSILITIIAFLGILTMFMPYLKIETAEVTKAFNVTFVDIAEFDTIFEDENSESVMLLDSRSGIKLLHDVAKIKTDHSYNHISALKKIVISLLLVSWISAIAVIVVIWVLKKRARYIVSMIFSFISFGSALMLYFGVPSILKNALIEAIEKSLFNDYGIYENLLGNYVKNKVLVYLGIFCKELLQHSVQVGFWILIVLMFIGFIVSLLGLVLENVMGKDVEKKSIAKIYGINGEYAGAEVQIGRGIVIGRDPTVCQLVINKENISRRHCKIEYNVDTNVFNVTDYSKNGTYVLGGKRLLENVPTELAVGTTIQLGNNEETFRLGE